MPKKVPFNRSPYGWLALCVVFIGSFLSLRAGDWTIESVAGTGMAGFSGDGGSAKEAKINDPYGLVRGPDGALWFCEHAGHRIRRIARDGTISTIAGTGQAGFSGDGGSAREAMLNLPHELRFDAAGNLFIADTANQVIRRIDLKTGIITTVAGQGGKRGYAGDGGAATDALFNGPHSLQFNPSGDLFVCDVANHVVRRIDARTGIITTFAGTGKPGATPDGSPIAGTPLNNPRTLDFDHAGDLWLATREGNQVFRFDLKTGKIWLVAGNGQKGFTGNGGPAREATLSGPKGLALDRDGNVWLADTESHSVRMIDTRTGKLELIAGAGVKGDGSDGNPLACAFNRLHGIFADTDGSVYIGDSEAHRIRVLKRK
ncbi:MAG: hypothetical protein QM715_00165 [Nibricoccus sp.]